MTPSRPPGQPQQLYAFFSGAFTAAGAVALWFVTLHTVAWYIRMIG